jgi:hypothetical protein
VVIDVDISADFSRVEKMLGSLSSKILPKAAASAMNRTAASVRGEAVKVISKSTGIKQKEVRRRVDVRRANLRRLTAVVVARRYAPNLIEYVARSQQNVKTFRRRLRGGRYKYKGVISRAWGEREVYDGTFIGRSGRNGRLVVLRRSDKKASGVVGVSGPSVRRTFIEEQVERVMRATAAKRWRVNIDRELKFRLSKL